eukprot:552839_1
MSEIKAEFLEKNGYVVVCNIFDDDNELTENDYKLACNIVKRRNFKKMIDFADNKIMPLLSKNLNWSSPCYGRTFMSDNDNPHSWHRDLYSKDKSKYPQQYTCLLYLHSTRFYAFGGSHKQPCFPVLSYFSGSSFTDLSINKGDVVVIYSHLIHRGHFDFIYKQRMMIQLFETFPSTQSKSTTDSLRDFWNITDKQTQQSRVKCIKFVHSWFIINFFMQLFSFLLIALNLHEYQPTVYFRTKKRSQLEKKK